MRKSILFFVFIVLKVYPSFSQSNIFVPDRKEQIEFLKNDTIPVNIKRLPEKINTSFSEYNGILFPDSSFYFSSLRNESDEDYSNFFEAYWSMYIYQAFLTPYGYSSPIPLPPSINNRHYFNANFTFNKKRDVIFFTRCKRLVDRELQCEIWTAKYEKGKWSKATMLNRRINLPGSNTTQPFLVEYDDFTVLYFSSDRPHGYGEMDIWYSIYKNGHFEDPINAGSNINTIGSEITPFYDQNTNRLYFSSDYHIGIGGYDIFYSKGALSNWETPVNMGVPFNSEWNDYYFVPNSHNRGGYFCSNRPSDTTMPEDSCCYDIFDFFWPEPLITDSTSNTTLPSNELSIDSISKNIASILPLTLYFHNDEPDPNTRDTTTKKNYQTTLADYISLRSTYIKEYTQGLYGEEKEYAEKEMRQFFQDSVEKGFEKLQEFSLYLDQLLAAGAQATIKISGYASALHKKDYNLRLSMRRIHSFINYINEYQNGIFAPYLSTNRLIILSDPKGSIEAAKNINHTHDKRNSVYSINAALDRRIQIIEVEILPE